MYAQHTALLEYKNKEPLRVGVLLDFSASLEMTEGSFGMTEKNRPTLRRGLNICW